MTSNTAADQNVDEVYVWIWLPGETDPVVAGRIEYDQGRYVFNYGRSYLDRSNAVPIYAPELPLRPGHIEPLPGLEMANSLRDGAPDAWGRRVIINHLTGKTGEGAARVSFNELTYMLNSGSDRIGALDFQASPDTYVPRRSDNATLEELLLSAQKVEKGEPLRDDLDEALRHGSSIGGARPKALIQDGDVKYIAKFSASNDLYSTVKAEFIAMQLAALIGIDVAPVRLVQALGKDVLLIERFDRTKGKGGWQRRAMVSSLTLFELNELSAHHASYAELADIIRTRFTHPRKTLRELFSRLVFNILVSNTDDHARNHAAFWDGEHLELTPAYDICPQARNNHEAAQAMNIRGGLRESRLIHCIDAAADFLLQQDEAIDIISTQILSIRDLWDGACAAADLSEVDKRFFWRRQFLPAFAFEGVEKPLARTLMRLN